MKKFITYRINKIIVLVLLVCFSKVTAQTKIINVFSKLSFSSIVDIQHPKDNSNRLFFVSQEGLIHVIENNIDIDTSSLFLDIKDQVQFVGESGLLGLAFHPDYQVNGYFFLNYVRSNPSRTVISRFKVSSSNPDSADRTSEFVLLEVLQPYPNHNGGQIAFGPDGYLYISFGDGGSGGDPENRAQNLSTLLGKMVRIDIDKQEDGKNYSIPNDNPYKGNTENISEEIYAYGLRNVWRFSFDSFNRLWAADVGQDKWEEINLIEKGGNYGWRIMEGSHCYNPIDNCNQDGLILPLWEYYHEATGGYSITGGYLYEGIAASDLYNKYIYADIVSRNIWAFDPTDSSNVFINKVNSQIATFGIDENNDLYFADYNSGLIYKFDGDSINIIKPPTITLNPQNDTTQISDTARFIVLAECPDPIAYQWWDVPYISDEVSMIKNIEGKIEGAQSNELRILNVEENDNGKQFVCSVNNAKYYPDSGSWVLSDTVTIVLDTVTSYSNLLISTPLAYEVSQNYPNPFNPLTEINYSIIKPGHVSFKIYDILGKEVLELVNENQNVGDYNVSIDAAELTSGIYFYRMQSGAYVETKKMILLK